METGVGIDVVSVLKTVRSLSGMAIEDFAKYREGHDPSHLAHAAECLEEIQEFIGGEKLPLMIFMLKGAAQRKR